VRGQKTRAVTVGSAQANHLLLRDKGGGRAVTILCLNRSTPLDDGVAWLEELVLFRL
jgi:hypothetical protein